MSLPETVTKEEFEKLPEVVRDHYKENEGKFHLSLVPKQRLDEFRQNNINLLKERDDLKVLADQYKDLDPAKAREALAKLKKLDEKNLLDEGKVEELFTQRTGAMKNDYEGKLATEKKRGDNAEARLSELLIDSELRNTAIKPEVGARPTALTDITLRAKSVWTIKEGKAVAMKDGNVLYGKDGNPLTMNEWLVTLRAEAPHLFADSTGGGANNDKGGGSPGGKERSKMTTSEKVAYIAKHGQEGYEKLPL